MNSAYLNFSFVNHDMKKDAACSEVVNVTISHLSSMHDLYDSKLFSSFFINCLQCSISSCNPVSLTSCQRCLPACPAQALFGQLVAKAKAEVGTQMANKCGRKGLCSERPSTEITQKWLMLIWSNIGFQGLCCRPQITYCPDTKMMEQLEILHDWWWRQAKC